MTDPLVEALRADHRKLLRRVEETERRLDEADRLARTTPKPQPEPWPFPLPPRFAELAAELRFVADNIERDGRAVRLRRIADDIDTEVPDA